MLRTRWVTCFCLAASLSLLSGCWTRGHRIQAPTALSFSETNSIFLQGIAVTTTPTFSGDASTFSVTPDLPTGLTLDSITGQISGTPAFITPTGDYTVTAKNAGGETSIILTITIHPQAPCGLAYQDEDIKYIGQISVVTNPPSFGCGPVASWTIVPSLPAGLLLDPTTGEIVGIPTEVIPRTEFFVTAENVTGSDLRAIFIEVETPAPCGLAYSDPDVVYPPTVTIPSNQPSSACGAVELYEVDPALPPGLSLDSLTGEIIGSPTVETGEITYTITASNSYGSDSTEVKIRIAPVFIFTAESLDAEYESGNGSGSFQVRLFLEEGSANATFPTPIIGLSMALGHSDSQLTPVGVFPGADLAALHGGAGPDFFEPMMHSNAITVGIIFSFDLTELLLADGPKEAVLVDYATSAAWLTGNLTGAETVLNWGNPNPLLPITNEVGLSGTYSVIPIQNDSTVTLTPAPTPVP